MYIFDETTNESMGLILCSIWIFILPWLKMIKVLFKNPDLLPMAGKLLKIKSSLKVTETYGW